MNNLTMAVLFGSRACEHDVSIISALQFMDAADRAGYRVVPVYITREGVWYTGEALRKIEAFKSFSPEAAGLVRVQLDTTANAGDLWAWPPRAQGGLLHRREPRPLCHIDVAVPVLHGKNGEDGTIQGLFELAAVPYTGCGVLASATCMDKAAANTVMDAAGVPHCRWLAAGRYELEDGLEAVCRRVEAALPWPVFVKPANAGSSVGISKAKDRESLRAAIATALAEDDKVIFEEFIDGQEVECAAIGNPEDPASVFATRPGEILAGDEFYTYDDKYKNGVSQVVIPAHLSEAKLDEVQRLARKAYLALGCTGLSRCDFFVERGSGRVLCNELNTMPGFTAISMYPKLMENEGLSFSALADRLIELALHKRKRAY